MSENLIGATTAVFPIRLSVAVASPVDVEWATRDGSAIAGSDYKAASGTVTFLPGETEKQIEVQVYGQAITPADDKVFFIRLNPPSNAVLVDAILTCTINIIDDQGIPSVAVVVAEGRRGPKGDPGLSAYEQAVLMGYTGTLAEWMDQIADASKAADRAEGYAISAGEDALKAQNAAKNAVFAGVVFPTASEGVDPILGVKNGSYFNVRSPLSEHYIDEYQNVNGVAVATGKSYPTSEHLQNISDHTALPFVNGKSYVLHRRVQLDNGDIVKSTIDGNTNDPNVDMTGWRKPQASESFDESGLSQQVWNNGIESISDLLAISNPNNGNRMFVNGLQGGWFTYDSDAISLSDNILFFNGWKRQLDVVALRPEWAGAVRDGLTDDSAAFQITYNATAKYGFSVKHTDGTYAVKSPITIDGSVNQFKFIVLKGTFRGNGINAKFFPSTNNGTTIKTFGNAFLEVKFLKYWNEAVSVQGIAVVDSVGNGDFAFRMTKGGFPNNIADFRYNTGFIFEDVATVGFKDDIVFRGNYRKDQGGIYNNNYFGQVTLNRVYTYEGTSSIVLENATLNRFSAYDTMFFTMSSGAVVKRPNPLIPADQNTEMHFMGQFNMCHFEDCRGMFRFDDTPATNERNFVTLIDTTREFCGLFDQNNGNPLGVFKHTDLTLIGRFDQKGYGETTIPELEVGSSVTTDRKLDVKLTNAKSLSPNFINVFSSEIAVLNGETVTKNVFCADGTGKQFQITTDLIINSGQGGVSKIESVGVTGSTGHHDVVNSLSPNITVTCNSAANNMQQISVTNNSGATIYIWINVIKNVTGVQCYLT